MNTDLAWGNKYKLEEDSNVFEYIKSEKSQFRTQKVGKYYIQDELGKGSYAQVYKAYDPINPSTYYAIKAINKKDMNSSEKIRELFETELQIYEKIDHMNIIKSYDKFEIDDYQYIVQQYCNKGDLAKYIETNGPFKEFEAIYFLQQIMNGVKHLHDYKIMHRDIKLENIFLNEDQIIIGDLGLAKIGVLEAQTRLGTPLNVAPEVISISLKHKTYTNKCDLWSIGICFYEMLTGEKPWKNITIKNYQETINNHSGPNLPIHDLIYGKQNVIDLLKGLIEVDPEKRFGWEEFWAHETFRSVKLQETTSEFVTVYNDPGSTIHYSKDQTNNLWNRNTFRFSTVKNKKEQQFCDNEEPMFPELRQTVSVCLEKSDAYIIKTRFDHELSCINFIERAAVKCQDFTHKNKGFLQAWGYLVKKCQVLSKRVVDSLTNRQNCFNLSKYYNFDSYFETNDCLNTLITFQNKLNYFIAYSKMLLKKLNNIHETCDKQALDSALDLVGYHDPSLEMVNEQLKNQCLILFQEFLEKGYQIEKSDKVQYKNLITTLSFIYVSWKCDVELGFWKPNMEFDWRQFIKALHEVMHDDILNKAYDKMFGERQSIIKGTQGSMFYSNGSRDLKLLSNIFSENNRFTSGDWIEE